MSGFLSDNVLLVFGKYLEATNLISTMVSDHNMKPILYGFDDYVHLPKLIDDLLLIIVDGSGKEESAFVAGIAYAMFKPVIIFNGELGPLYSVSTLSELDEVLDIFSARRRTSEFREWLYTYGLLLKYKLE